MTVRTRSARPAAPQTRSPAKRAAAKPRTKPHRGANLLFLTLAVLGSLHAAAMLGVESWRFFDGQQQVARLEAEVAALELERSSLQAVLAHEDDPLYREQLARCLGFAYPEERRYLTVTQGAPQQALGLSWCQAGD